MGIVNYPCAVLNIRGNEPIVTNYECYSLHTFHRHLNLLNINFPLQLVARQCHFFIFFTFYFPSYSSWLHFLFSLFSEISQTIVKPQLWSECIGIHWFVTERVVFLFFLSFYLSLFFVCFLFSWILFYKNPLILYVAPL